MTTDEIYQIKPTFGDVDLIADVEERDTFIRRLKRLHEVESTQESRPFGVPLLRGFKQHGTEVSCILQIPQINDKHVQIDFEFKPFVKGEPTKFAQFSQSSPLEDLKMGIPGVYHKQLIMALADCATTSGVFVTRYKHKEPSFEYQTYPLYKFSVAYGLRRNFVADPFGYRLIKPAEATYTTNIDHISRMLLNNTDFFDTTNHLESTQTICTYVGANWTKYAQRKLVHSFYERLFGDCGRVNRSLEERRYVMEEICKLLPMAGLSLSQLSVPGGLRDLL